MERRMQFLFGHYVLDPERRELTGDAEPIAIGPQVFDLLLYLVRHRERVVSKDEVLEAVWSGRIVSESTLTSHVNAARKAIGDNGSKQELIRTVARKGFRFVGDVVEREPGSASRPDDADDLRQPPSAAPPLPDRPSIATLPFLNLSGDAEQDYFTDGVVEDIISALSRIRWLFVIARNSSFTYKGRAVDVKQVGRELGVRYVLEGSVRRSANRVRITGQLIDAATGAHLWAERFEGALDDIFEVQDQVTASVVGAIVPQLEHAEIERAQRKPTESLDAYDYYLRGMANLHRGSRESIDQALAMFAEATARDPDFASAHALAAWSYFWRKVNGWMVDRPREIAEGVRLARRSVELGKEDAVALARGGHALAHLDGDLDGGIALLDRALVLNPNLAAAWFLGGFLRLWHGEPDEAVEHFSRAMRLSPLDPELYRMQAGMAVAHYFAGDLGGALSWAEKAAREMPDFTMVIGVIAASHALSGRQEEADRAMARFRDLDPKLRLSTLNEWLPIHRPQHLAALADGLRKAGLPE
jgi:TolB-like protein